MKRIQDATAVASLPAPPALTGPEGYFTGGNPGAGVPATRVRYWWLNMIQEELIAFLTAAGISPSELNSAQVLEACRKLFGGTGSLAIPGYMRLPGGLMIQWGTGVTASGVGATITFPIAFPTACLSFSPTDYAMTGASPADTAWPIGGRVLDRFSAEVRHQETAWGPFSWIALGH